MSFVVFYSGQHKTSPNVPYTIHCLLHRINGSDGRLENLAKSRCITGRIDTIMGKVHQEHY
jgi:hypothetical protein